MKKGSPVAHAYYKHVPTGACMQQMLFGRRSLELLGEKGGGGCIVFELHNWAYFMCMGNVEGVADLYVCI